MSELHQTWSSFQCSVAVKDIFLAPKSNQTKENMLLKETDTIIDAILIVVLEQKQVCNPNSVAMFGFSFVTSVFRVPRVTGTSNVTKTSRGRHGFRRDHVTISRYAA